MRLRVGHQQSRFLSTLARFVDYYLPFWGPKAISIVIESQGVLTRCRQDSQFGTILARFLDYYSLFCGPGVISIVVEPQGALMCRSLTLTVLADTDPFHGLLLTVLGSRSYFHGC